jgi:hypothetical protein
VKRGGELKRTGGPERRTSLRRSAFRRKPKRRTELERAEARAAIVFGTAVRRRDRVCQACGYDGVFVQAHHVIPKSRLRKLFLKKGQPLAPEVLHDPDNGLLLCTEDAKPSGGEDCHGRHTTAFKRIPARALRPENWAFAERHGLTFVLEAEYPA